MEQNRLSWNEYFMEIAELVAKRSTCLRRQVGAIAVLERQILATGYNGSPKGMPHCSERGCLRQQMNVPSGANAELCYAVHAEQNVIIQAACHGVILQNADIYCTHKPCFICAKMLANCNVKTIYFKHNYPDENTDNIFKQCNINLIQL